MMRATTFGATPATCAAVLALAVGACSAQDDRADAAPTASNCIDDTDCPAAQTCQSGLCSTQMDVSTSLNFRFIPATSADFLPQSREHVRVASASTIDFLLRRAITVSSGQQASDGDQIGGIRYVGDARRGPSGRLIFRPQDVQAGLFIGEARVTSGQFDAHVNPGVYSLTFVPEDRTLLPKKTWSAEEFTSNTVVSRTLLVPSDYLEVDGRLTRQVVLPGGELAAQDVTVAGARVYASSADGDHTTTVVTTDDNGRFSLKVEPDTGAYDIHVVPANADAMLPSTDFDAAFATESGQCTTDSDSGDVVDGCHPTLNLGAYPADTISVRAQLQPPPNYDGPAGWQGTTVVVTTALGRGDFDRRFAVDRADGRVDLRLYPADVSIDALRQYRVEIIPPANSPFARTDLTIGGNIDLSQLQPLQVDLKQHVTGTVRDALGDPMSAASLEFRLPAGDQGAGGTDERLVSATTDDQGAYDVWLSSTDYDALIIPGSTTGQPRQFRRIDAYDIADDNALDFQLPAPSVAHGAVLGAQDSTGSDIDGVADVTVQAYRNIDGRTVIVGQSRTDAAGDFRMALSADL